MARQTPRPTPTATQTLKPLVRHCLCCGETMWAAYHNYRTITTLDTVLRLTLQIRRCLNPHCSQVRQPYRPEAEGRLALPKHEFGLDVMAYVGTLRYAHHRSIPELHHALSARGVAVAPRTVTNLLERYDELVALNLTDTDRLQRLTQPQGRVLLALDGLQPDVGHEVLWVLRDCLSGEVLLAQSLLSAAQDDLAELLRQVKQALSVPIAGVISDGQPSIRAAVQQALPKVPHQLCHFHYLRSCIRPLRIIHSPPKPATMSPFHHHLRGHCHGTNSLFLPTRSRGAGVRLPDALLAVAQRRRFPSPADRANHAIPTQALHGAQTVCWPAPAPAVRPV
jgi:hypothetical protein